MVACSVALVLGIVLISSPVSAANNPTGDIVDTAVAAGQFQTLATALQAAGLVDTLKGKGPFTVFAPTDKAFAKLPKGTVEALLKDIPKLTAILTYHVVPGKVMAEQVVNLDEAPTVNGDMLRIRVGNGGVQINDSNVVKTDVLATNGVIHVVDTVILPKN
jgi:uncharacterized surface protein with fasciclin (FAS1) repeats